MFANLFMVSEGKKRLKKVESRSNRGGGRKRGNGGQKWNQQDEMGGAGKCKGYRSGREKKKRKESSRREMKKKKRKGTRAGKCKPFSRYLERG
jgi:hypothetical protein